MWASFWWRLIWPTMWLPSKRGKSVVIYCWKPQRKCWKNWESPKHLINLRSRYTREYDGVWAANFKNNDFMLDAPYYQLGTIPAHSTGWCGAAFPADSARLPEAVQTGQPLCHFWRIRHGWGSPSAGWWQCAEGARCEVCTRPCQDQGQVQKICEKLTCCS